MTVYSHSFVLPAKQYYPKDNSLCEPLLPKDSKLKSPMVQTQESKPSEKIYQKYFPDGSKYFGTFLDDKRHGFGQMTDTQKNIICGTWDFDKLNPENVQITYFNKNSYLNRNSYFGRVENYLPHGRGTMTEYTSEGKKIKINGIWEQGLLKVQE